MYSYSYEEEEIKRNSVLQYNRKYDVLLFIELYFVWVVI